MSALQPQALRLPREEGPSLSTQDDCSHERGLALAADGLDAQAGDERMGPGPDKTGWSALRSHPERVAYSVSTGRGLLNHWRAAQSRDSTGHLSRETRKGQGMGEDMNWKSGLEKKTPRPRSENEIGLVWAPILEVGQLLWPVGFTALSSSQRVHLPREITSLKAELKKPRSREAKQCPKVTCLGDNRARMPSCFNLIPKPKPGPTDLLHASVVSH